MRKSIVRILALAAALAAAVAVSFAQSRPPYCIPYHDTSSGQSAPYC
jgi:hypothetical protein